MAERKSSRKRDRKITRRTRSAKSSATEPWRWLERIRQQSAEIDQARTVDTLDRIADALSRAKPDAPAAQLPPEPATQKPADDPARLLNPQAAGPPKSTKSPVMFTKWLTAKFNAHAKAARATRSKTPPLSAAKLFAEAVDAAKRGEVIKAPKNVKVVSSMLRQLRRRLKR
jgi:hypothetical protein